MKQGFEYVGGSVPYYKSRLLDSFGISHAFFTKQGGVSGGCFESLNFALGAGDKKDSFENILENHKIAAALFGLTENDICRSYQTHTANVELVDNGHRGVGLTKPPFDRGVDGLVTAEKELLLSVRSADCVPILLADKSGSVCGAVHAGWRGTVKGIAANAVEKMESAGAKRGEILAAIGPCIGGCCYEVGPELLAEFLAVDPEYSAFFTPKGEKYMLDLVAANRFILERAGLPAENIDSSGLCTKCRSDIFFSHRVSGSNRGTMSAVIALRSRPQTTV